MTRAASGCPQHHHDASHALDDQISAEEERLLHGCYTLTLLLSAACLGAASDRINRKMFILSGMLTMVFGALVLASAVSYQSDVGFRRGEVFFTSLLHGLGAGSLYVAAVAAVAERSLRSWRPIAVATARAWWELGRVCGYLIVDPIARGAELTALCMLCLAAVVIGLWFALVYKDERAELGAQEERPEPELSSEEEEEQQEEQEQEEPEDGAGEGAQPPPSKP